MTKASMRDCIVRVLLAVCMGTGVAVAQKPAGPASPDPALTRSIDHALKEISSIQPGMTRAELLRVFRTEGGLSTRDTQQFVYRGCPYIKVVVNFREPADADDNWMGAPEAEWTGDVIQSISKPFLEYPITD